MAADTPSSLAAVYLCACVRGPCDLMLVHFCLCYGVHTPYIDLLMAYVLICPCPQSSCTCQRTKNHQYHLLHTVHVHTQVYTGLDIGSDKVSLCAYFGLVLLYCSSIKHSIICTSYINQLHISFTTALLCCITLMQPATSRRPC
jgi:hypothetical protein